MIDVPERRAILARTPMLLDAWLRGLDDAWLDCDEGPDTWSPRQVVAHLVHGERTDWIPRLRHIAEHGTSLAFEPFDRFAHLADARPIDELLDDFAALRAGNLRELDALLTGRLSLEDTGMHPELGVVSAAQLFSTWAAHDLGHVVQIARTMARRYTGDVGPWAAYLSVLSGGSR